MSCTVVLKTIAAHALQSYGEALKWSTFVVTSSPKPVPGSLPGIKALTLKVGLDQARSGKARAIVRLKWIGRDERSVEPESLCAIPPAAADDVSHLGGATGRGLQESPHRLRHRRAGAWRLAPSYKMIFVNGCVGSR